MSDKNFNVDLDKFAAFTLNELATLQGQITILQAQTDILLNDRFPGAKEAWEKKSSEMLEFAHANALQKLFDRLYLDSQEMKQRIQDLLG